MDSRELAEELAQLNQGAERLLKLTEGLERSPVIDKTFAREMAQIASLMVAHTRQAAKLALP